jgi:hypothetical protein
MQNRFGLANTKWHIIKFKSLPISRSLKGTSEKQIQINFFSTKQLSAKNWNLIVVRGSACDPFGNTLRAILWCVIDSMIGP